MNELDVQSWVYSWPLQQGASTLYLVENIFPTDPAYHQKVSSYRREGKIYRREGSLADHMGLGPWEASGGAWGDRYSLPEPLPEFLQITHLQNSP